MLLSSVPVLVVAQSIFEIPEGIMNNPVYYYCVKLYKWICVHKEPSIRSVYNQFLNTISRDTTLNFSAINSVSQFLNR